MTRSQLKQILGGDDGSGTGGSGLLYNTSCYGDKWNPSTLQYDRLKSTCDYTPPIGGLPGTCDCPYTVNATACS